MSIFDYLRKRNNQSASIAKERLQIIISHERSQRTTPDYLPKLQKEIIEVIAKYVPIDPNQVMVNIDHMKDNTAVLELNITMPEEALAASSAPKDTPTISKKETKKNRNKNKAKASPAEA
ncbi:MAG: cell division topological specificity factor MinE [Gammaproteobacteria bacterium]|nr:cell division topological specificity factor MinE [Gammaproteobacteria bacterium]